MSEPSRTHARKAVGRAAAHLDDSLRELSYARDELEGEGDGRQEMLAIDMSIAAIIRRQNIVNNILRKLT